jgi:TolA protein
LDRTRLALFAHRHGLDQARSRVLIFRKNPTTAIVTAAATSDKIATTTLMANRHLRPATHMNPGSNFASAAGARHFLDRYRERMIIGLTLSLLIHGFIVSLEFGLPGLGLPSMASPWHERHAREPELQELHIRIANVRQVMNPEDHVPAPEPVVIPQLPPPISPRSTGMKLVPMPKMPTPAVSAKPGTKIAKPKRSSIHPPTPVVQEAAPATLPTSVIARTETSDDTFVLPAQSPEEPTPTTTPKVETPPAPVEIVEQPPVETPAKIDPAFEQLQAQQAQQLAAEESVKRAQELEARKQAEAAALQQAAVALALQKQAQAEQERKDEETARQTQLLEAKKLEDIKKQEEEQARRLALEHEIRKQAEEAARLQAAAQARQKQAEELAARELANRRQAEAAAQQRESERIAAANQASAASSASENSKPAAIGLPRDLFGNTAGKALEQLGKSEPRRIDPHSRPSDDAAENSRRRSIFGSYDRDIGLTMYIESWRQKIERNGSMNYRPSARDRAREDPVVTVSIRSDGSVEEIAIDRSSGLPELDDAVRRIVRLYARYSAFPPDLARKYDVIEIRRIWNFDERLRILEEVH